MRRSRPDPATNSERTGSFYLVSSQRLAMLLPAVLLELLGLENSLLDCCGWRTGCCAG